MDSPGANKQLGFLYPSMSTSTRIAVVGGGPSGLSAALALVKLGYKNVTVLEQYDKVGGMCGSEVVEGRVYDLGGQVIARESSPTLVMLMNELDVDLEEMGHHTMSRIDCDTGKMEKMKIVADCLSLLPVTSKLQVEATETRKLGVHAVSSLAHEVVPHYLRSKGFGKEVPRAVAALFTASGYGYPQDMPYAYLHEFVRSSLGQAWRVRGGYSSFWQKVADILPDVRCNMHVKSIQRSQDLVRISVADSSNSPADQILEFDKIVMSGSVSIPTGNRIYRSSSSSVSGCGKVTGILDYSHEELELFSKVETIDYYTTLLKVKGLDIPAMFYYPEHADDPSRMGRFVAMQRFYAETDVFLFWSYGTTDVQQQRVTELLYEDVQKMGGCVETLILQRKWRYFPHVRSPDMAAGFYNKLDELQGKSNTYYTGALLAFELTERNTTFSMDLIRRCFGSTTERLSVKRLIEYPLPTGAEDYKPEDLTDLPGLEFPDLYTVDDYVSFYANHPVTRDRVVYTWLDNQGKESHKLTYSELDNRVSIIAQHLLTGKSVALKPGDRVVLLHPPGLEFIEAFLGCLRARILAVPLIPPDPTKKGGDQALEKLVNVVKITDAKAILSTRAYHSLVRASSFSFVRKPRLCWPTLPWIHTNCLQGIRSDTTAKSWMHALQKEIQKVAIGLKINPLAAFGHSSIAPSTLPEFEVGLPEAETKERIDGKSEVFEMSGHLNGMANINRWCSPRPRHDLDDICFLQFTSGSTGDAKGVMISHGALMHNVKSMRAAYKSTSNTVVVSWLPQYHDMGLIGGLLVSMVTGGALVIFSPITFIRKPMMWLEMVEKYKATHTAAPNFGFELVLKRFEMLKKNGRGKKLDLSSLRFLMVGAEPISSQTMRGFVETFWDAGIREEIFAPGFGMAENCVFICCAFGRNKPVLMDSHGRVCCGYTDKSRDKGVRFGSHSHSLKLPDEFKDSCSDVRIVNPESLEEVGDGVEGEIWLSSPSNGIGYWGMAEATEHTFRMHLKNASKDDARIEFLRSGDLGRVIDGNLFVTGRIKDLIIVNGRNYYPSDIEKTVENCSVSLRPGCSAAFSAPAKVLQSKGVPGLDSSSEEAGIVIVAEVRDETKMNKTAVDLLKSQIKAMIAEDHGLQVAFVNLVNPRSIPKTTSGKIRRRECLKRFSEDTLLSVKGSANLHVTRAYGRLLRQQPQRASYSSQQHFEQQLKVTSTSGKCKEEISNFLVRLVADMTGMTTSTINVSESFENYSIDSQGTVAAASKLSEFLGTHISAIQIYTTGCISELADFCSDVVKNIDSGERDPPNGSNFGSLDCSTAAPISSISSQGFASCSSSQHKPCQKTTNCKLECENVMEETQQAETAGRSQKRQIKIARSQVGSTRTKSKEDISNFLVQLVADTTGISTSQINVYESFENYSIDSQGTVASASKLSEFLDTHISAIQIYTTGCISELVDFCDETVKKNNLRRQPWGGDPTSPSDLESSNNSAPTPILSINSQGLASTNTQHKHANLRQEYEDVLEDISEAQLAEALDPSVKRQIGITTLQVIGILYMGCLLILPALYIYDKLIHTIIALGDLNMSVVSLILASMALVPVAWIIYMATIGLVLSLFGARILLPMNHKSLTTTIPLWSVSYVKWWTLYRLQDFASNALAGHLRGTIFLTFWYRLLGANIDDGVSLDTIDITDPALLSIGSGTVIGEGVTIQSHEVNGGTVSFQSINIGRGCVVGPYAVVQGGSVMDAGSSISALEKSNVGEHIYAGQARQPPQVKTRSTFFLAVGQLLGLYLVGVISTIAALVAYTTFVWLLSNGRTKVVSEISLRNVVKGHENYGYLIFALATTFPRYLAILAPLVIFPNPAVLVELLVHIVVHQNVVVLLYNAGVAFVVYGATLGILTCALKWSLIGRVQGGHIVNNSHKQGFEYRLWLVHALLRSAHEKFMVLLMGTEALSIYLRSLGAKVGKMASIRRLNGLVDPDLLNLGEECHLGDFSKIITSHNVASGSVSSAAVTVGNKCVVGAQSVLMPGSTLHQQAVLGAMSVAPSGVILEEGGVYVGVKAPIRIYQQKSMDSFRDLEHVQVKADQNPQENEHALLAGMSELDPRFRQMIASVAAEFVKKTPAGEARYIHSRGSAGKGTMRVMDNLPARLPRHDILSPGATYPIILRCSNGVSKDDDRGAEVRGSTLRVLRPDCPDDLNKPLLDLFMKTGNIFHARNMVEFLSYYIMTEDEREERIKQFPALGESQWGNLRKPNSYAELHYYCCTTRLFRALPNATPSEDLELRRQSAVVETDATEKMYVKFKLRPKDRQFRENEGSVEPTGGLPPLSGMLPPSEDDTRSKSFLRDEFKVRLESLEGVRYVLQLQLHPIPASEKEREELQDPTKVWDEKVFPYMDVAELWLNEHLEDTLFDDIHFNPKHGPRSLAMINATSAMQAASIDQGRSIMHDLLGYLRSGTPLPPLWYDLVKKSFPATLATHGNAENSVVTAPGCPMMSGRSIGPASLESFKHFDHFSNMDHDDETKNAKITNMISSDHQRRIKINSKASPKDELQSRDMTMLRFIQPILQVVAPLALLVLALYPSLLALAFVGTKAGKRWMYGLLPVGYLCTGLVFATLSICCKWGVCWKIKDGHTHELWSPDTLRHTVWDAINQTLASTFLELGKGSVFCIWYLQGLGASIKDTSVYMDTLHALNPDQLRVGSRSAIGRNALLFGHLYEGEKVAFKSNFVGNDAFIGTRALVLPGLKMEDGAQLPALGLGMKDEVIRGDYFQVTQSPLAVNKQLSLPLERKVDPNFVK